jgi:thiol-disulfide isomerase/thioredoxin
MQQGWCSVPATWSSSSTKPIIHLFRCTVTFHTFGYYVCLVQAVLFFWASWSAPCKHMQQVLEALAKQHGGMAYLQVRVPPMTVL